jgi:hypothetical protein
VLEKGSAMKDQIEQISETFSLPSGHVVDSVNENDYPFAFWYSEKGDFGVAKAKQFLDIALKSYGTTGLWPVVTVDSEQDNDNIENFFEVGEQRAQYPRRGSFSVDTRWDCYAADIDKALLATSRSFRLYLFRTDHPNAVLTIFRTTSDNHKYTIPYEFSRLGDFAYGPVIHGGNFFDFAVSDQRGELFTEATILSIYEHTSGSSLGFGLRKSLTPDLGVFEMAW